MTYSQSASTASRRADRRVYGRRRRGATLAVALALFAVYSTFAGSSHARGDRVLAHHASRSLGGGQGDLSRISWPQQGEAALALGSGRALAGPDQRPVPIASVAKVMTAYLTLERYPLAGTQDGFTVTVTSSDARAEAKDAAEDQSVAAVQPGERLTERQLLEALLIPSGNNIARMLAAHVGGSDERFVTEMNAAANALGMHQTTYTDPSGWDSGTVSTAADQLVLLRRAMRLNAFRQIVSMPNVTLPVAGTLTNTNPLIAQGYDGKTGSDSAAGACLAFFTPVTVGGRRMIAAGVVLGQWESNDSSVVLAAAGQAAQQLVGSIAAGTGAGSSTTPSSTASAPQIGSAPGAGAQGGPVLSPPGNRRRTRQFGPRL